MEQGNFNSLKQISVKPDLRFIPIGIDITQYCVNEDSVIDGQNNGIKISPVYRNKMICKVWDTENSSIKSFELDGRLGQIKVEPELSGSDESFLKELRKLLADKGY